MATRVNLYCLVGDSNAGKSKTIRSLADGNLNGVGKLPDLHSVRLHDGGFLKTFVRVTSFQELNSSPQGGFNRQNLLEDFGGSESLWMGLRRVRTRSLAISRS